MACLSARRAPKRCFASPELEIGTLWVSRGNAYLSISSPPVDEGGSNLSLSVLPSTAASDTFEGGSLGCGSGIAYGVSATAGAPAA